MNKISYDYIEVKFSFVLRCFIQEIIDLSSGYRPQERYASDNDLGQCWGLTKMDANLHDDIFKWISLNLCVLLYFDLNFTAICSLGSSCK